MINYIIYLWLWVSKTSNKNEPYEVCIQLGFIYFSSFFIAWIDFLKLWKIIGHNCDRFRNLNFSLSLFLGESHSLVHSFHHNQCHISKTTGKFRLMALRLLDGLLCSWLFSIVKSLLFSLKEIHLVHSLCSRKSRQRMSHNI